MTFLLIILAAWALVLLFVAGLCTMARRGDVALARAQGPAATIELEAAMMEVERGPQGLAPAYAAGESRETAKDPHMAPRVLPLDVAA
jgi:hypothetical protein